MSLFSASMHSDYKLKHDLSAYYDEDWQLTWLLDRRRRSCTLDGAPLMMTCVPLWRAACINGRVCSRRCVGLHPQRATRGSCEVGGRCRCIRGTLHNDESVS